MSSGSPVLVQEGLINPGPGVADALGAAAIDPRATSASTWIVVEPSMSRRMWPVTSRAPRGNHSLPSPPGRRPMPEASARAITAAR